MCAPASVWVSEQLRERVAFHLRRVKRLTVEPEELCFVGNLSQGTLVLLQLLLDPGDKVGLCQADWPDLEAAVELAGGVPCREFDGTKLVCVTKHLTSQTVEELLSATERSKNFVLEVDRMPDKNGKPLAGIARDRVVHLGVLGNLPGWLTQFGYVVLPPKLQGAFVKAQHWLGEGVSPLEQHAIANFMNERRMRRTGVR